LTKQEADTLIAAVIRSGLRIEQEAADKLGVCRVRNGMDAVCILIEIWTQNYEVSPAEVESLHDLAELTVC